MALRYLNNQNIIFLALLFKGRVAAPPGAFPSLANHTMAPPGRPSYSFPGVDYAQLPEPMKDHDYGCREQHMQCLKDISFIEPVCGYNRMQNDHFGYVNICHLTVDNCAETAPKQGLYGINPYERMLFYMGDGENCQYYDWGRRRRSLPRAVRAKLRAVLARRRPASSALGASRRGDK